MKTADVCHYANAKIPEISVGPVISVNQNFLTLPFLTNRFIIAVLLLTYVANSEKEYKLVRARLLLVNSPASSQSNTYHRFHRM